MQALRDINGGRFTVDVYNSNDKLVRKGATLYYRKYRQGGGTRYLLGAYGGLICIGEDESGYAVGIVKMGKNCQALEALIKDWFA